MPPFWGHKRPTGLDFSVISSGPNFKPYLSGWRTKERLAEQCHSADVGRKVRAELKRIEAQLINAGLMPDID